MIEGFNNPLLSELRLVELRSRRKIDAELMGRYRSAFRGSGLVFSSLREYAPGDDIKHIDWKSTARTGKVYVKSYEEERQLSVVLAVDISNSTDFGKNKKKSTKASEFSILISLLSSMTGDKIGLCLFGNKVIEFLPPKATRSQVHKVVYELAKNRELSRGTDINLALDHLAQYLKKPSLIFVVSDFICADFSQALTRISAKHDLVLVELGDATDQAMPSCGLVQFCDAETGERLVFDTSNGTAARSLALEFSRRSQNLSKVAQKAGAEKISIDLDYLSPLKRLMDRRSSKVR